MPNLESIPKLSWTHYVQIISLKSRQQREFYERAAAESSWTVRELKEQIKADLFADARQVGSVAFRPGGEQQRVRLTPRKGELYTYRLIPSLPGQAQDLVVDLGFDNHWIGPIQGIAVPRAGMIVTATKSRGGSQPRYHFSVNRRRGRTCHRRRHAGVPLEDRQAANSQRQSWAFVYSSRHMRMGV